mgnify:CR=1 FL=1
MATKVIMPKQGLQMTEGTITQWLVQEGGKCVEGEPLFEMETDKLTITMDSTALTRPLKSQSSSALLESLERIFLQYSLKRAALLLQQRQQLKKQLLLLLRQHRQQTAVNTSMTVL